MTERTLNAVQVASMLVSTSCGVGFLLGTGELALQQGMAACLYPIATALGLTALALCSRLLWTSGQSVWAWFDQLYGPSVSQRVALLSLLWMTGVLAAQIRGGTALLVLTGVPPTTALLAIDATLIGLSIMRLSWLSAGFAICMLACNATLVESLINTRGIEVWLHAPLRFVDTLPHLVPVHTVFMMISIVVMVVCGADYQQFLIAARTPTTARVGCILAAGIVFVIGFLPESAVVATAATGHLGNLGDSAQVIPVVLIHTLSNFSTSTTRTLVIAMLASTALGAGCAILRAMSDAIGSLGRPSIIRPLWSRVLPVIFASLVALRGQSIVEMMVDLNIVYITAVGALLGLTLLKVRVSDNGANSAILAGFCVASVCYLIRWLKIAAIPEATSLCVGLPLSLVFALTLRTQAIASPHETSSLPRPTRLDVCPDPQPCAAPLTHFSGDSRSR
jgi:SSS family solute:Na+ symporter